MGDIAIESGASDLRSRGSAHILLIEDDAELAVSIADALTPQGFVIVHAADVGAGRLQLGRRRFHAVALDVNLPDGSGLDVAAAIRAAGSDLPILMLTARSGVDDRVEGLRRGADDYLCKPFAMEELAARLHALIRRSRFKQGNVLEYADVKLDLIRRTVSRGGEEQELSTREVELLAFLITHPEEKLTRQRLLQDVWGDDFEEPSNVINVYINYLRNKLERFGKPRIIHTVRGIGYMFSDRERVES